MKATLGGASAVLALAVVGLASVPAPASALTVTQVHGSELSFSGSGCGTTDVATMRLPVDAHGLRVSPASGSALRDVQTGAVVARLTSDVRRRDQQLSVRFTATGSDDACSNQDAYSDHGWVTESRPVLVRYSVTRHVFFRSYIQGGYLGRKYRPRRILFGERSGIQDLLWSHWDGRVARGRGTLIYNNCIPNCAEAHGQPYRVNIRLSRVRLCGGRFDYTRFAFRYPGAKPSDYPRSYSERHAC
jgi:hypothetical protein